MPLVDSVDKIICSYFAAVTSEVFSYKGEVYKPCILRVSPGIFRGYTCPSHCGGCCFRFSLDYLPGETPPTNYPHLVVRLIDFDGRKVKIYSDPQDDHNDHFCRNLRKSDGRCGIHGKHPFSCDFELLRVHMSSGTRANRLTTQLFSRGWAFTRVDGKKGAKCEMLPPTNEWRDDASRKLRRLMKWADHFGITTCLLGIVGWVESGPHQEPAFFNEQFSSESRDVHLSVVS